MRGRELTCDRYQILSYLMKTEGMCHTEDNRNAWMEQNIKEKKHWIKIINW